jgi:2-polyprenyl-6-hydroxyphenyl methylase/3-demethylubiquinone-9 3-methyltransferase
MISRHEAIVASRFDVLHARFKRALGPDDPRLEAIIRELGPLAGQRVLDLGSGKGRFARALAQLGAQVIALDLSARMLGEAEGLIRLRASARRLPFRPASFDSVIAVEVFEHLAPPAIEAVLSEIRRVLSSVGTLVVIDKNACSCNVHRPWLPSVAVKWLDERRGLWMYRRGEGARERWFLPGDMKRRLRKWFRDVRVVHLLSRAEEGRFPFQYIPGTRLFVLWAAQAPGGAA